MHPVDLVVWVQVRTMVAAAADTAAVVVVDMAVGAVAVEVHLSQVSYTVQRAV
jgi:hypothetical protein